MGNSYSILAEMYEAFLQASEKISSARIFRDWEDPIQCKDAIITPIRFYTVTSFDSSPELFTWSLPIFDEIAEQKSRTASNCAKSM